MRLRDRYRRWHRYRSMVRELTDYSHHELTELGIAKQDIYRIAYDAIYGADAR